MDKIKVGVIGVGHLGKLHTKMFSKIPNCNLVGIFDTNTVQAKLVADEFGTHSFSAIETA